MSCHDEGNSFEMLDQRRRSSFINIIDTVTSCLMTSLSHANVRQQHNFKLIKLPHRFEPASKLDSTHESRNVIKISHGRHEEIGSAEVDNALGEGVPENLCDVSQKTTILLSVTARDLRHEEPRRSSL